MTQNDIGFKSRLPNVVVELEERLGKRVNRGDLANEIGFTRQAFGDWMKSYQLMARVNADTLFAILQGLEAYALKESKGTVVFKKRPEDIVELVGWEINKIEGLPIGLAV